MSVVGGAVIQSWAEFQAGLIILLDVTNPWSGGLRHFLCLDYLSFSGFRMKYDWTSQLFFFLPPHFLGCLTWGFLVLLGKVLKRGCWAFPDPCGFRKPLQYQLTRQSTCCVLSSEGLESVSCQTYCPPHCLSEFRRSTILFPVKLIIEFEPSCPSNVTSTRLPEKSVPGTYLGGNSLKPEKMFSALPIILSHWTVSPMIKLLLLWQRVKHSLADLRVSEVKDATGSHDITILVHNRDQNSVYRWYGFSPIYHAIISGPKIIKYS